MAFEMAELPMTTNQIEHLRLIDAHLERLLAIAEKRTPGGGGTSSRAEDTLAIALLRLSRCKPVAGRSALTA